MVIRHLTGHNPRFPPSLITEVITAGSAHARINISYFQGKNRILYSSNDLVNFSPNKNKPALFIIPLTRPFFSPDWYRLTYMTGKEKNRCYLDIAKGWGCLEVDECDIWNVPETALVTTFYQLLCSPKLDNTGIILVIWPAYTCPTFTISIYFTINQVVKDGEMERGRGLRGFQCR